MNTLSIVHDFLRRTVRPGSLCIDATAGKAFSYGLIDDEQAWIALLNARNQTSHLYDDATAQEIYSQIESEFVSLFDKLIEQLKCG